MRDRYCVAGGVIIRFGQVEAVLPGGAGEEFTVTERVITRLAARRPRVVDPGRGPWSASTMRHERIRRWIAAVGAVLALATLCGCASLSGREDAAAAAARRFEAALAAQDAAAVCAELAPGTRQELEDNARSGCDQAVFGSDVPAASGVQRVDVYGQQARVVLGGDTLFLSSFPTGWKITAAGCEPRPRKPYKCELKGG